MKKDECKKSGVALEETIDKIKQGATYRRLRTLVVRFLLSFFLLLALAALFFFAKNTLCTVVSVLLFLGSLACLYFVFYFFAVWRKLKNEAPMYSFTVTESASFECFGPYLALNVTYRKEDGKAREGRTKFLFSPRDVEAWQNVPLEIAYKGEDERIVVIGSSCR